MEIGRLTEQDLAALAGLYQQFRGEESSMEKMRATFRRLKGNPSYMFLGAKQEGRLVGSVMGIICEDLYGDCKPFMVVENVVVERDQWRRGIGSALMCGIERCAVDHGCNYILFVTDSARTKAQRFYESLGYKPDAYKGFKKYLKNGQQQHAG